MKLRTKIFLLASLLVVFITSGSFYVLNNRFSKTITNTIKGHFHDTKFIFEQIINYRSQELVLRCKVIADLPKIKAAISTRDINTINAEIDKLPIFDPETDLYILADNSNHVITYRLTDEFKTNEDLKKSFESFISKMQKLTDIWTVGNDIYQIAAQQIYVTIQSEEGNIGYFVILGDKLDDSIADELKKMTNTDINIGGKTLFASTFKNTDKREDVLSAIQEHQASYMKNENNSFGSSIEKLTFGDMDYVTQFGVIEGQALASFIISRPYDSEFLILSQLRNTIILLAVISVLIVFIISFFVSRSLTDPLAHLVAQTKNIAEGNLEESIFTWKKVNSSGIELKELGNSFEQMRLALKDNIEKITDLNRVLFNKNKDLQQALEDLKKAQDELIKSERMSTIGKIASSIIHDFKSPMQVIVGMTELIGKPNIDEEKKNNLLKHIKNAVMQMNTMTYEILDFVRGETNLTLEKTNISNIFNEILLYLSNDLQKNNFKVMKACDFNPEIEIDIIKMKRVLENIIRNSIEASSDGNTLQIKTEQTDGYVRIRIQDDGPGIAPDILEKIFEPFVTKGKIKGTGLGLAISKKIVEDHKGVISCTSTVGKGTEFTIDLPLTNNK